MKITKENLIKENAVLKQQLETSLASDLQRRTTLSELLNSYEFVSFGYSTKDKKVWVRDWLGIAFLIGELKADADYAICIQRTENLQKENGDLRNKIYKLENPEESN